MPTMHSGDASQRILIVSHNPALRERLYDLLTRHGYRVTTITAGQVGYEALQHQWPNLILANSLSCHDGGLALADRVRTFNDQLPIILLNSRDEEPLDDKMIRKAQACLAADVPDEELLRAITRWLPRVRMATPINYPGPILLIDDEPELLRNLEAFLVPRGCAVITATSGAEGLERIAARQPALVILDIKMPGMDGLLTLKKIKSGWPQLPVIIETAVEDRTAMVQAFTLGAFEYITKPYNLNTLQDLLIYLKDHGTGDAPRPGTVSSSSV